MNKIYLSIASLIICSCSHGQDKARNDDWRISPPPTAEEMSHYRIVQNESKTAYAVQSTNTCWLDEHDWLQCLNTWNTLRECTNNIHEDVGAWRKRINPEKWEPITYHNQETNNPWTNNASWGFVIQTNYQLTVSNYKPMVVLSDTNGNWFTNTQQGWIDLIKK